MTLEECREPRLKELSYWPSITTFYTTLSNENPYFPLLYPICHHKTSHKHFLCCQPVSGVYHTKQITGTGCVKSGRVVCPDARWHLLIWVLKWFQVGGLTKGASHIPLFKSFFSVTLWTTNWSNQSSFYFPLFFLMGRDNKQDNPTRKSWNFQNILR